MSEVSHRANKSLILADYANLDAGGKLNIIGGGVAMVGFEPSQGVSTRITLVATIDVPGDLLPAEFSVEVMLMRDGALVNLPGPAGPQPLRIGEVQTLERPQLPGPVALRDHVGARRIILLDFSNGLPLAPGGAYEWVVQVDGDEDNRVSYPFVVAPPPAYPVIG